MIGMEGGKINNNHNNTYTTSLEIIHETMALRSRAGRAVCGEEVLTGAAEPSSQGRAG